MHTHPWSVRVRSDEHELVIVLSESELTPEDATTALYGALLSLGNDADEGTPLRDKLSRSALAHAVLWSQAEGDALRAAIGEVAVAVADAPAAEVVRFARWARRVLCHGPLVRGERLEIEVQVGPREDG
jgi:hypothetical protein